MRNLLAMTSTNLTRTEAQQRSALISNVSYIIDLDLSRAADPEITTFPTVTTVRFTSQAGSTFLDARVPTVNSVVLDGTDITASAVPVGDGGLYDATTGVLLQDLAAGEHELRVEALGEYSTTGQGLHRFTDPADGEVYLYTQFETADAKRVFACFDQPDIKATYEVSVTTDPQWSLVTNNAVHSSPTSGGAGTVVHTSRVDYRLSTYLIAFCVGPWHEVRDSWTGTITRHPECAVEHTAAARERGHLQTSGELTVPLGLYCRKSLAQYLDAEELFTITKQGFDWYAEHFGVAYPFYKYDQVFCPEYNMGAMENAGCVTIRDEYIFRSAASHYQYERRADTILHELAHMWFGDLVTMAWWDDLWLNESFATWSAAMSQAGATKYTTAWVTFASKEKAWAYSQDQLSSTHPVFSNASDIVTVDANFDGITYAKGASVLKQLAEYVGLDAFLAGIRAHFVSHAWDNATFDDLLGALERTSGRDLSHWADAWLKTTGINTLHPQATVTDGVYSSFRVVQTGAQPGADELRPHRIGIGVYGVADPAGAEGANNGNSDAADHREAIVRLRSVDIDVTGAVTDVPELVGTPAGQIVLVNDRDLTYALMGLDRTSLTHATAKIDKIADPMARSLIWSAAWQMTRNAQMRAREFVALVARGAAAETELAVLEQILSQARLAVENYADPRWAATGWTILREAFLTGAQLREGSAAQLAFVRAYAGCAHSAESVQVLRTLLAGGAEAEQLVPGLTVDQDLRWLLVMAVAASGRVSGDSAEEVEALIAAEEQRDRSSSGAALAVEARCGVATPGTKREVYDSIVRDGATMTNLELRHRIAGFNRMGQRDLREPFGPEYVAHAVDLWNSLSPEMALRTAEGMYPDWDLSEQTDQAVAQLIAAEDTPAGLRRPLQEGRDRVARARAAQAADAQATFYESIGGEATFRKLVGEFYRQVRTDDILGPMYPEEDLSGAEDRLRWFLAQYWGGPEEFNARRGHPRLRMRHAPFAIDEAARDRWLTLMRNAMDTIDRQTLPDAQRAAMWEHMERVAHMLVNTAPTNRGWRA
ncbi:Aminopeptidase N [Corynebacterium heidelbergense]|nr:Aminopeptidase N [Corynebacterium heidelbergense]